MYIKQLALNSFGGRSGFTLKGFSEGVNIIYGPNEAGKTTMMEAVRAALFGFLDGRVSTRNRYELAGGQSRHISLQLITRANQLWHLDRTEGRSGLKIIDENNNSIPEAFLAEALHHADRDMYENIFAFSLKELSTFSSLDAATIQDRLLGTALGAGAVSPAVALKNIEERKNKIYKPKGKKCETAIIRKTIDEAASQISKLRTLPSDYDMLVENLFESRLLRKKMKDEKVEIDTNISLTGRLLNKREEWDTLRFAEVQSSQLVHAAKIPLDALTNLENLSQETERTHEKLKEQESSLSEIRIRKSGVSLNPESDPYLPELETFISEGTSQQFFPNNLKDRQDALDEVEQNTEHRRLVCGNEWTPEQAEKVSPDRALKQEILIRIDFLRETERKHRNAESRVDDLKSRQTEMLLQLEELTTRKKSLDSLSAVPQDAVNLVGGIEVQIQEIKSEESRNRHEQERLVKSSEEIEVDARLAQLRHKLEKCRAELSAASDLSERIAVNVDSIVGLDAALSAACLQGGKNVPEDLVRKVCQNDRLTGPLANWQEKWSELRVTLKASSASFAELKETLKAETLAIEKDFEKIILVTRDRGASLENCSQLLQDQKSSLRDFDKRIHLLKIEHENMAKLDIGHKKIIGDIKESIRRLGPNWDENQVRMTSLDATVQQSIKKWSEKILTEKNFLKQLRQDIGEIEKNYEYSQGDYERVSSELKTECDVLENPSFELIGHLREWLTCWNNSNTANNQMKSLQKLKQEKVEETDKFAQMPSLLKIAMGVVALVATGSAAFFFITKNFYPGIISAAAGFIIVLTLYSMLRNIFQSFLKAEKLKYNQLDEINGEIEKNKAHYFSFEQKLTKLAKSIPEDITLQPQAVEKLVGDLEYSMNRFLSQREDMERVQRLKDQIAILKKNLDQKILREKEKTVEFELLLKEWGNWISGLPGSLSGSPEEVISILYDLREIHILIHKKDTVFEEMNQLIDNVQREKSILVQMIGKQQFNFEFAPEDFDGIQVGWERQINQLEELRSALLHIKSLNSKIVLSQIKWEENKTAFEILKEEWQTWLKNEELPAQDDPSKAQYLFTRLRGAFDILIKRNQLREENRKAEEKIQSFKTGIFDEFGIKSTQPQNMSQIITLVEEKYQQSLMAVSDVFKRDHLQKESGEAQKRADEALERLERKNAELHKMVQDFGFKSVLDFHESKILLDQYADLNREISRIVPDIETIKKLLGTLEHEKVAAAKKITEASNELNNVLVRHHLPENIDSTILPDFIDSLIEYVKSISTLTECRRANLRIRERWDKMTERYSSLLKLYGFSTDFNMLEPEMVIGNMRAAVQKLKDEATLRQAYNEYTQTEKIAEQMVSQMKSEYTERLAAFDNLLKNAGAPDPDTFRGWISDAERLRVLKQTINEKEAILMTVLDITDRSKLSEYLKNVDWENKQVELNYLLEEQKQLDTKLSQLEEKIGADEQKKNDYEKKADLADFRQAEASGIAHLETTFSEWMEWEIATQLISMARDRFEKERQPEVLKEASEYFKILTGGSWRGIRIRLGEKEMEAIRDSGEHVPIINLSSGTAEPLYLAMRLALITDFAQSVLGSPPVIMDDILVNFDDRRAANAATAIMKIGKSAQVILLTCHGRTVQQFKDIGKQAMLHDITCYS